MPVNQYFHMSFIELINMIQRIKAFPHLHIITQKNNQRNGRVRNEPIYTAHYDYTVGAFFCTSFLLVFQYFFIRCKYYKKQLAKI